MAYEVLARKWRPQQFEEVVGQDHVVQTLKNAIESDRIAHAYLFVGPRGVGKTSIARIFAKALNCRSRKGACPCDACDSCREIMAGNSLDVLEIDGASNNGVEQVRDLRDSVKYAPARGPYKIYMIDEVHMLSVSAFNALLKTLEEPPAHVKFIFATTEPQKVLTTILSRCQRYDLRRISIADIATQLGMIAKAEDVVIEEEALLAIARGAEGGLRDAESALDQLISFRGKQIAEPDVLSVFGLVSRRSLEELAWAILGGDYAGLFERVADLDAAGKDLQRLSLDLLEHFRNVLLVKVLERKALDLDIPEAQFEALAKQAAEVDLGRLHRVVDVLIGAQGQLKFSLSRRTLLEMALIRAARISASASLDEVMSTLADAKEAGGGFAAVREARPDRSTEPGASGGMAQKKTAEFERRGEVEAEPEPDSEGFEAPMSGGDAEDALGFAALLQQWKGIVERVARLSPLTKGYLKDALPVGMEGKTVVIGLDPEFASHEERLTIPRNLQAIQKVLGEHFHHPVAVVFRAAADLATRMPETTEEPAGPVSDSGGPPEGTPQAAKQKWAEDEAVKKTLEHFGGVILNVREE
ncbi:MAG TPA: DNA polymerase III subunit gamma/tau [Kiritimatiellia bacterium]|nr:DNA polymerase III subunit gamma/tau [Kiritimatiellia bacterium]